MQYKRMSARTPCIYQTTIINFIRILHNWVAAAEMA